MKIHLTGLLMGLLLTFVQDSFSQSHFTMVERDGKTILVNGQMMGSSSASKSLANDSVIVRIELNNIPDTLVFSQTYIGDYYNDYSWGVSFDVDGIDTTGTNGCEIEIASTHYKTPGEAPFKSNIINGTYHILMEWIGHSGYWRHTNVSAWIDPLNRNILVMSAPKSWPELSKINANTKYYVRSYYYSNSGPSVDQTSIGQGMVSITDPVGDVSFSFIDIVSASWSIKTAANVQTFMNAPIMFTLDQNYPNPFNPSTDILFSLPSRSFVTLKVFDLVGREMATLVSEELSAGNHSMQWSANGMPSGVYFYRLQAGAFTETKKLVLLR